MKFIFRLFVLNFLPISFTLRECQTLRIPHKWNTFTLDWSTQIPMDNVHSCTTLSFSDRTISINDLRFSCENYFFFEYLNWRAIGLFDILFWWYYFSGLLSCIFGWNALMRENGMLISVLRKLNRNFSKKKIEKNLKKRRRKKTNCDIGLSDPEFYFVFLFCIFISNFEFVAIMFNDSI